MSLLLPHFRPALRSPKTGLLSILSIVNDICTPSPVNFMISTVKPQVLINDWLFTRVFPSCHGFYPAGSPKCKTRLDFMRCDEKKDNTNPFGQARLCFCYGRVESQPGRCAECGRSNASSPIHRNMTLASTLQVSQYPIKMYLVESCKLHRSKNSAALTLLAQFPFYSLLESFPAYGLPTFALTIVRLVF